MMRFFLSVYFLFFIGICSSQNRVQGGLQDILRGHSLYILNENLEINIYGRERSVGDGSADTYRSFRIFREVTYKIVNQEGLAFFDKIILPEHFDDVLRFHASDVKKLGAYYSAYDMDDFSAKVKREGKKPFKAKVKFNIRQRESFNIDFLYEYSQHVYSVKDLQVGDEVTITYDLTIPFQENYSRFASYRIFHHGALPKLKYKFTLTHHESLDLELYLENGSKPKRSYKENKIANRIWEFENLPGCLYEEGSRPYLELPYVTWVLNHYKYYVHNSNQYKSLPHYALIAALKSPDLVNIFKSVEVGSRTKEYAPFHETFDRLSTEVSKNYEAMYFLHTKIVDDFNYEDDLKFYRRSDMRAERLGEYFSNSILRDASRYNLYFAILVKAKLNFYSAYIIDKRGGEVSDEYFQPNFDNDFLLAVYLGEKEFDFILPKRHRFGWYYNELPFYYEDALIRLVHVSDYAKFKFPVKEIFRSVRTDLSSGQDNTRNIQLRIAPDLGLDTIIVRGITKLSGQYSTMNRAAYMNGYKDPSVNKLYNRAMWENITGIGEVMNEYQNLSSTHPFDAEFSYRFGAGNKIDKTDDGFGIDLSGFFTHILPKVDDDKARYLTFYPDFMGNDKIEIECQFLRPVSLKEDVYVHIQNDVGVFVFSVSQEDTMEIKLISEFQIHSTEITSGELDDLNDLLNEARKYKKYRLEVK